MKKEKKSPVKQIRQIDYMCMVGERVFWLNLRGERFEGVIKKFKNGYWADVEMDDGTIIEFEL